MKQNCLVIKPLGVGECQVGVGMPDLPLVCLTQITAVITRVCPGFSAYSPKWSSKL